ncbi:MAG: hypothetical protein R2790_02135 [Flavobacterium haoranii]
METKNILQCNKCDAFFEIFQEGIDRINNAKAKGWSSIIFNCPNCGQQTTWNRLVEIHNDSSLLNIENKPKQTEIKEGILPEVYFNYLKGKDQLDLKVTKDKDKFNLFSLEELFTNISIDKNEYLTIFQLKGYFKTLKEVGYEFSKKEIELFENALAIGDENGDVLFIDKREDNSKLYIFYPDGGDIEKTKLTINDIIKRE